MHRTLLALVLAAACADTGPETTADGHPTRAHGAEGPGDRPREAGPPGERPQGAGPQGGDPDAPPDVQPDGQAKPATTAAPTPTGCDAPLGEDFADTLLGTLQSAVAGTDCTVKGVTVRGHKATLSLQTKADQTVEAQVDRAGCTAEPPAATGGLSLNTAQLEAHCPLATRALTPAILALEPPP